MSAKDRLRPVISLEYRNTHDDALAKRFGAAAQTTIQVSGLQITDGSLTTEHRLVRALIMDVAATCESRLRWILRSDATSRPSFHTLIDLLYLRVGESIEGAILWKELDLLRELRNRVAHSHLMTLIPRGEGASRATPNMILELTADPFDSGEIPLVHRRSAFLASLDLLDALSDLQRYETASFDGIDWQRWLSRNVPYISLFAQRGEDRELLNLWRCEPPAPRPKPRPPRPGI